MEARAKPPLGGRSDLSDVFVATGAPEPVRPPRAWTAQSPDAAAKAPMRYAAASSFSAFTNVSSSAVEVNRCGVIRAPWTFAVSIATVQIL